QDTARQAIEGLNEPQIRWTPGNYFAIRRGPYVIASVMEESVHDRPLALNGRYVDLFDPRLPVVHNVTIPPGKQALLDDLDHESASRGKIIAASSRIEHYREDAQSIAFTAKGPRSVT